MINQGRTFGAVARYFVVGSRKSAHRVHGADSNDIGAVSRRINRGVSLGALRVVPAIVSSGDDYHDPSIPRLLNGLAEGILSIASGNRATKRKIDDANVVLFLESNRGLNRRDHGAIGRSSILIQHSKTNDIYVRCNSANRVVEPCPG